MKNMRQAGVWPASVRSYDDVEVLVPDIASAYKSRMKMADLSSAEEVKIFEELKEQITEVGIELKNNLESYRCNDECTDIWMIPCRTMSAFTWASVEEVTGMDNVSGCLILSSRKWHMFSVTSDFHVKAVIRKTDKDVFVYDVLPASEEHRSGRYCH